MELLRLVCGTDLRYAEIAKRMGWGKGTVRSFVNRILEKAGFRGGGLAVLTSRSVEELYALAAKSFMPPS